MKCLPQSKLALAKGTVLHDCHAEILAIRAFNRWLVDECAGLAKSGSETGHPWLRWRRECVQRHLDEADGDGSLSERSNMTDHRHAKLLHEPPFAIQDDVEIHMYCSQPPCGDASMELTMAQQPDATPWTTPPLAAALPGRANFDRLGIVRRKPSRPDAPITLSKSCSDKLALKQCTSLLSGVVSLLVHTGNAHLRSVVLPENEYVPAAVQRAFGREGRMKRIRDEGWRGGYAFKPFEVRTTRREFEYSRGAASGGEAVPSNLSALYTPHVQEAMINGALQGRKQFDPKGASSVSRRRVWEAVEGVSKSLGVETERGTTYEELKGSGALMSREMVKREVRETALQGWMRNLGDEDWSLT